jgi:hypothetical protein
VIRRLTPLDGNAEPITECEGGEAGGEDADGHHADPVHIRAMTRRAEREAKMERPRSVRMGQTTPARASRIAIVK